MAAFPPWTGYDFVETLHHSVPEKLNPALQNLPSPFVVCITGSSRGIGAETAKAFAAAGATGLILTARSETALKQTKDACQAASKSPSFTISVLGADAGSPESAQRISKIIKDDHGRLDLLINNAGIIAYGPSAFGKLDAMDENEFCDVMQVNYLGRVHLIKQLLPLLLQSPSGARTVVNIGSISSHLTGGTPFGFNISELAANRLTESLAEMYAEDDLTFHTVHPGFVDTTFPPGFPDHFRPFAIDKPNLCGAFLVWLAKEKRDWLNGRYISSNWDVDELETLKDKIVSEDKLKMRMVV